MCEPNKTIIAERKYLYQLRNICGIPPLTVAQRLKEKQRLSYVHIYVHAYLTYIHTCSDFLNRKSNAKNCKKINRKKQKKWQILCCNFNSIETGFSARIGHLISSQICTEKVKENTCESGWIKTARRGNKKFRPY